MNGLSSMYFVPDHWKVNRTKSKTIDFESEVTRSPKKRGGLGEDECIGVKAEGYRVRPDVLISRKVSRRLRGPHNDLPTQLGGSIPTVSRPDVPPLHLKTNLHKRHIHGNSTHYTGNAESRAMI